MRKSFFQFVAPILFVVLATFVLVHSARPQTAATAQAAGSIFGSGPLSSCPAPVAGWSGWCNTSAGVYISNNGAAYFLLTQPVASAGVTSVTICSVAGTNCGVPLTGAVNLPIPSKVIISPLAVSPATPTGTLQ